MKMQARDLTRFAKMWNDGADIVQISYEFGISESGAYSYANRHKDVCEPRKPGVKKPHIASLGRIAKARKMGVSAKDLAEAYGVHHSTIRRYVQEYDGMCEGGSSVYEGRRTERETVEELLTDFAYAVDYLGNCDPNTIDEMVSKLSERLELRK
jgi:transposase